MLQVVKYYTNSENKITHAEVSYTVVDGELSATASTIMGLRAPLSVDDYTEAAVFKSIAIHVTKINNLIESARTKLEVSALTETVV